MSQDQKRDILLPWAQGLKPSDLSLKAWHYKTQLQTGLIHYLLNCAIHWEGTATSAAEKYMSPKQVRWLAQSKVIIPFSNYLRKGLELTNYLTDEVGCFSPFIFPARPLLKDLNYLPMTAHFQETGWGQDSNQLQLGPNNHVLGYWDHRSLSNGKHLLPK